jgi:DNA-binding NtrC family response regulator
MSASGSLLVVGDDAQSAALLQEAFIRKGYLVDLALNAGDALMLVSLSRPDAVILDIHLPDTDGAGLLSDLRAFDESITVVMLSGSDNEDSARALLKTGAFDYVRRPFQWDRLEQTVGRAIVVGKEKPRRGVVLPFNPDRRKGSESSLADADTARQHAECRVCREPVLDDTRAVVEKGWVSHAACWLGQRARRG